MGQTMTQTRYTYIQHGDKWIILDKVPNHPSLVKTQGAMAIVRTESEAQQFVALLNNPRPKAPLNTAPIAPRTFDDGDETDIMERPYALSAM